MTTNIKTILFDLDDTLFDHSSSESYALLKTFAIYSIFETFETHMLVSQMIETFDALWSGVLKKQYTIEQWQQMSFQRFCQNLGILDDVNIPELAGTYRQSYLKSRRPIVGANTLLSTLKAKNVIIGIVTNHLIDEQIEKIKVCEFEHSIDFLVCADQFNLPKPDSEIFLYALAQAKTPPESTIFIGDSWQSDVIGALNVGIKPIWYNPRRKDKPQELETLIPEIHSLRPTDQLVHFLLSH